MKSNGKYRFPTRLAQALFVTWLIAVNVIYYLQFRTLALSRLPHWLTQWPH